MTGKMQAFVKQRIDNPTKTLTQAVIDAGYDVNSRVSASVVGRDLMTKPGIIMALAKHAALFESAIVGTVSDWKDSETPRKREIALNAAMFGHDKIFGKATVKLEQQTSIVKINIDLTGSGGTPPPEMLEDL